MPVTRRQREILDYITKHLDDKGYAPSFEEIARQFGFQSLATVHEHLTNLERKGYIRRTHNESRAIEVVPPKARRGRPSCRCSGSSLPASRSKRLPLTRQSPFRTSCC